MATSDYSSTFTSSSEGDCCLLQSCAQVMVRRDIGWEPLGPGGLSRIELRQRHRPPLIQSPPPAMVLGAGESTTEGGSVVEYYIEAYRIQGKVSAGDILSLECKLDQETSYHRISPTFHCWTTKTSKIGLTFDTFEAADNFERLFNQILKKLDNRGSSCHDKPAVQDSQSSTRNIASVTTKEDLIMKTWGSCQHIGQIDNIPCPMKCFQSPPSLICTQVHDCLVCSSPPPSPRHRHYRSMSAASAPCLLRLNTMVSTTCDGVMMITTTGAGDGRGQSSDNGTATTTAPSTHWLSRLLSCVSSNSNNNNNNNNSTTRVKKMFSRGSAHSGSCSSSRHRQNTTNANRASQDVPSFTSMTHQDSSVSNDKASGGDYHHHHHHHQQQQQQMVVNTNTATWLPSSSSLSSNRANKANRPGVLICVYCRRRFRPQSNPPGSCELAPDSARRLVDIFTCRPCGRRFIDCFQRNMSSTSLSDSDLNESLSSPCICCARTSSSPDIADNGAFTSSTNTLRLDYRLRAALGNKNNNSYYSAAGTTSDRQHQQQQPLSKKQQSVRRHRSCLLCLMYCLMPCLLCYRSCLACHEACLDRGCVGGRHSVVHHRSLH